MTSTAQIYGYVRASSLSPSGLLDLQTSGGTTTAGPAAHPRFFSGFLGEAEPAAAALLGVANIAQARYWRPNLAALRDPVVTCNGDRLRFESFSGCCGVYARLDVLRRGHGRYGAWTAAPRTSTSTTTLRLALARVRGGDPLQARGRPGGPGGDHLRRHGGGAQGPAPGPLAARLRRGPGRDLRLRSARRTRRGGRGPLPARPAQRPARRAVAGPGRPYAAPGGVPRPGRDLHRRAAASQGTASPAALRRQAPRLRPERGARREPGGLGLAAGPARACAWS